MLPPLYRRENLVERDWRMLRALRRRLWNPGVHIWKCWGRVIFCTLTRVVPGWRASADAAEGKELETGVAQ